MIFVTVGSQTPFDRLVRAVDEWCARKPSDVLAQIGRGEYQPRNMRWLRVCSPLEFRTHCSDADLIVAHVGMGSVLTALELGKPMLLLPRRADLGETRNDHQLASAGWLRDVSGIRVAENEDALACALDGWRSAGGRPAQTAISATAQPRLLAALRRFIDGA